MIRNTRKKNPFSVFFKKIINIVHWTDAFEQTYPQDGVNIGDNTINGGSETFRRWDWIEGRYHKSDLYAFDSTPKTTMKYYRSFWTKVFSFLGLPNRQQRNKDGEYDESVGFFSITFNVIKNFFGYQNEASGWRNVGNFILLTPFNIVMTPLKFLHNIVKIFTELLPYMLAYTFFGIGLSAGVYGLSGFAGLIGLTSKSGEDDRFLISRLTIYPLIYALSTFLGGVMMLLGFIAKVAYYLIGRNLTSPFANIYDWYRLGATIAEDKKLGSVASTALGMLFAAIPFASMVVIYTVAFPLLLKVIITQAPIILTYLPTIMTNVINFTTFAVAGFCASVTAGLIGPYISQKVEAFRNYWHNSVSSNRSHFSNLQQEDFNGEYSPWVLPASQASFHASGSPYASPGKRPAPGVYYGDSSVASYTPSMYPSLPSEQQDWWQPRG